jgi:CxxC motif-containing protein (DUF1111 family)
MAGLSPGQNLELTDFSAAFTRANTVLTTPGVRGGGLGPRFNSNSCSSCHAQPAVGGSSPFSNPLFGVYNLNGATNTMPTFITKSGPVVAALFPSDGLIHQLFTVTGRTDAAGCTLSQPDFAGAAAANNLVLRQPLPLFGDGMIDIILDSDIVTNMNANSASKQSLGITGHPNYSHSDRSIMRFGWKAGVKSLLEFSVFEAQVEKGVTNDFFPNEIDETPGCVFNPVPEDGNNYDITDPTPPARDQFADDAHNAANFVRALDQPTPAIALGTSNGQTQFNNVGCVLCHTQSFVTPDNTTLTNGSLCGKDTCPANPITVNLFSDLLLHHMGPCLADNISDGDAQGDEWRTPPLWGVGQRIFFLHDGRTKDIVQAIQAHSCTGNATYPASEANAVIANFNALTPANQQALINFLRKL